MYFNVRNLFDFRRWHKYFYFTSTTLLLGYSFTSRKYLNKTIKNNPLQPDNNFDILEKLPNGQNPKTLPTYTRKEVSDHYTFENRIWASYKDGVYDITDFIKVHPGGSDKILMGAGGSLEPFWEMYSFHKKPAIEMILAKYRIGNLDSKDILKPESIPNYDKLKEETIERSKDLIVLQTFPFCAESPNDKLLRYFYTPNEFFFIRHHNIIPKDLKADEYKIKILDKVKGSKMKLTLENLKNDFEKKTVETIIMCTGNRRSQMTKPSPPKGLSWNIGAISNGLWTGVLVSDVLKKYGYNENNTKGLHLIATGWDKDLQGTYYSISIPLEKVFNDESDVILAYGYNGSDIPYDHGYPLRLVVPGVVGVRNVKWLKSLQISNEECQSTFQQRDYKIIPKEAEWDSVDLSKLSALMEYELNSVIVEPNNNISFNEGDIVNFRGWAMGKYGSKIKSIEVSLDEGRTWQNVKNLRFNQNEKGKVFGWTIWEFPVDSKGLKGNIDVWVRAFDEEGNKQPENSEDIWNIRGLVNNSIHKIKINIL